MLKVESEGGVRIVTLNDPDKLNAMTDPLHEALVDVWVHIMRDTDARVVVITGAGRAFSAGGNIPGFIRTSRMSSTAGSACGTRGCSPTTSSAATCRSSRR